ncbi:MAG: YihY/virulence factor BrkB family protein [Deltaproteobacteria bacterium]|nr:YihY/virulence factor BrkB family protein [Deltaproteobacteria bacterium]
MKSSFFNTTNTTQSFFVLLINKISKDDLPTLSAALAYYSLLSLAPLSVALLFFWSFLPLSSSENLLLHLQEWIGPQGVEAVKTVFENNRQPNLRAWAGILTLLGIFIFGTGAFNQLQSSLHRIWNINFSFTKSWLTQHIFSVFIFFGIISFLFLSSIVVFIARAFESETQLMVMPFIPLTLGVFLFFGISGLYRWLSKKQITWVAAFQGAAFTVLLFEVGKSLFQIYLRQTVVANAYGAASFLVIFPLWIFYSSFIFLTGAEIAYLVRDRLPIWNTSLRSTKRRVIFFVILGILCLRFLAPEIIRYEINKDLQKSKSWKGYINDLRLGVFAGVVEIREAEFTEKEINVYVKRSQVDLSWWSLLKRELRFDILLADISVLVRTERQAPSTKTPSEKPTWREIKEEIKTAWPVYIDRLEVKNFNLELKDQEENAFPPFRLEGVRLIAENIWNDLEKQEGASNIHFEGVTSGDGKLEGQMRMSAFSPSPNFKGQLKIKSLDLRAFNSFFREKANFDLQSGKLDIVSEFASRDWVLDGYFKPMISDLKFLDLSKKSEKKSFWRMVWEGMLQMFAAILKNKNTEEVASKIRFSGRLDNPSTRPWSAVTSILRNAFVESLGAGFDRDLKVAPKFPAPKK